jgi:hypothetical protein
MKSLLQQQLKLWIFPVIVLLAVNYIYFFPVLQGEVITQDDIMMGLAKGKEIREYREATGEEPLWTNSMFSGMPTFQISTEYPNNWLSVFQKALSYVGGKPSSIFIIAALMIGFYFLLLSYKVNPWLSVVGSIGFGFSAFFIISFAAGHNSKVRTAAYMAPLIMGVLLAYRGRLLAGFALTALFLGMSINSGHYQITFYTGILVLCIVGAYFADAIKNKALPVFVKQSLVLAAAAILAIGPNVGNLWSTYAYTQETMRGGSSELTSKEESKGGLDFDYAMMWSYGVGETFNLVVPDLMGGGAKQSYSDLESIDFLTRATGNEKNAEQAAAYFMYWGDQSLVNGGYYVGAVIFFLFVFGLLVIKGVTRNWALAAMVLGLFLAWGEHFEAFNRFMFDYVPLFNKFRVPSMALVILFLIIPFIGILGVDKLLKGEEGQAYFKKKLLQAFYIGGGLALGLALIGPFLFGFEGPDDVSRIARTFGIDPNGQQAGFVNELAELLQEDRKSLMRSSAFTSFIFIALTFVVLWFYNLKKLKLAPALAALVVLVITDLWLFDRDQLGDDEFVSERTFNKTFAASDADRIILKDTDIHYRVFNATANLTSDSYTSYYHKNIGGYHGAKLMRYQDLIENQLAVGNFECLNMLNAKWIIQAQQGGPKQAIPNPRACGNAWTVDSIIWAADADAEMEALSNFNANRTVVIDERFRDYVGNIKPNRAGDEIILTKYDPKEMVYKAIITGNEDVVVFSEIFYEAPSQQWFAYIDGEKVDHIRVNYLLRGLKVPVGEHEIVFKFEPATYFKGEAIDLTFSILLVLALSGAAAMELRKKKNTEEETTKTAE